VPTDLQSIADPQFIVLAWAAGLALVAGVISLAEIVGPGFVWLSAGTAGALGLPGALAQGGWWARVGLVSVVAGLVMARNGRAAGVLLVVGGVFLAVQASISSGWLPVTTATLAVGGVTGEMVLGHWYLIDPRLPRLALRVLAIVAIVGLTADGVVLAAVGPPRGGAAVAFWILLATSIALMVAVIAALRYPAYSGVMAATGLSYLTVLTTLGAVFLGRALVAGLAPFAT